MGFPKSLTTALDLVAVIDLISALVSLVATTLQVAIAF